MTRICYPFVGDTVGGSHLSIVPLVRGLESSSFEPILVLHRQGAFADYLRSQDVSYLTAPPVEPVSQGPIAAQLRRMLGCAGRLARFLRSHCIDIVHTNDARMHLTWGLAAKVARCGFVWHQRSADNSRRHGVFSMMADKVVAISRFCRGELPAPMRNADVIYDPIEVDFDLRKRDEAHRFLAATLGTPPKTCLIGFVGNLTVQKRPLMFVEAARRLVARTAIPVAFPMIGELRAGVADDVRGAIASAGLEARCVLLGPRYPIAPWLAGLDLLAAPAVREGLGRALVEAMLVGTPVVAADDGGHREIVEPGRTGWLVPVDDPNAMALQWERLLSNPLLLQDVAQTAASSAGRRFSLSYHVRQMSAIYESLAR